jgi:hypothetical protein
LPLFLAVHQVIARTTDPVTVGRLLRVTYFVMFAANAVLVYAVLRRGLPPWMALGGTMLATLTITSVWVSDRAYADVPFALVSNGFLLAATSDASGRRSARMGALAATAYLLRTAGTAFLVTWIADAVLKRNGRATATRIAVASLCVAAWTGYIGWVERGAEYRHPAYPYQRAPYNLYNVSYTTNLALIDPDFPDRGTLGWRGLIARIALQSLRMPAAIGGALSNAEFDWQLFFQAQKASAGAGRFLPWLLIPLMMIGLGILTLAGAILLIARGHTVPVLLFVLYVGQLLLLPWPFLWPRYLHAMGGFVALAALSALAWVAATARGRRIGVMTVATPVLVVLALQTWALEWVFRNRYPVVSYRDWGGRQVDTRLLMYDEPFAAFDAAIDWVQQRAAAGDRVISSMPHWVFVRTSLESVMPPYERDRQRVLDLIDAAGARFVIVDTVGVSATREYAAPALAAAPARWTPAFEVGQYCTVFERR